MNQIKVEEDTTNGKINDIEIFEFIKNNLSIETENNSSYEDNYLTVRLCETNPKTNKKHYIDSFNIELK